MLILGIGGWLHDGAAALLRDGELVAAMEEEKLARQPHAGGLPERAIAACLETISALPENLDCIAIARPIAERGDSSLHLRLRSLFPKARIVMVDHHTAHAASAFYPSPFEEARVLTLDRMGDMRCGALWEADASRLDPIEEIYAPDSPAAFYSRVSELLGFRSGAEEHKVQWLSATGQPAYHDVFLDILAAGGRQRPQLDHDYFDMSRPARGGFSERFYSALGLKYGQEFTETQRADLAASVQSAVEEIVLRLAGEGKHLCLAGGLMLNSILVSALANSGRYQRVWVQPAAGNAGTSIGCAFHAWRHVFHRSERTPVRNLFLGPEYDPEQIKQVLENCKLGFQYLLTDERLIQAAVKQLQAHQIVAWFQGRMEFGSRALGNRGILASPLNPYSTENLNIYIKRREPFRKFAASVPEELASEYFECGENARHLASVSRVRDAHRKTFEAALLGDDGIRVHTVSRQDNPLYWELLHATGKASGLPVLYNTSFNLFGESLVCDPRAAVRSFYASGIDCLFVGQFLLTK